MNLSQQGHLINNKCPFLSQDTLFETEMVKCCVYLSDSEVGKVSGLLLKAALSVVCIFLSLFLFVIPLPPLYIAT